MKGWKGTELSAAGKEVLIKAVVQAVPNYAMGCFLLPIKICQELEKLVRNFWWGDSEDKRKLHWISWEKLKIAKEDGGLGFRDFRNFNIALLAKHTWRFIQRPDSLVSRVFQSKYYRASSILHVNVPQNRQVSHAFRSILAGRDLIREGCCWRIGSGRGVRIFEDTWVPRRDSFGLFTTCPQGMEGITVDFLMVQNERRWNLDLLQQIFIPSDADAISRVPIASAPTDDHLYWFLTDDGQYSVATGYIKQSFRSRGDPSSSAGHISRPLLNKLWKFKVPKKCIFPVWRLWHGSLAVGSKLRDRHMAINSYCTFCEEEEESEEHLFYSCPFAQDVWKIDTDLLFIIDWTGTIKDLIIYILSSFPIAVCEKFVMVVWAIWRARNDHKFNNIVREAGVVANLGLDHLLWFKEASTKGLLHEGGYTVAGNHKWRPPTDGSYCINTDCSWKAFSPASGLGAVIRDSKGLFIAGRINRVAGVRSCLLAELESIRLGLRLASELHLKKVQIQSDSLNAIKLLRDGFVGKIKEREALADMGAILSSCRSLLPCFNSISFSFIGRSSNNLAHLFAQHAFVEDDMSFYFQTPAWANDVLSVDLQGMAALD